MTYDTFIGNLEEFIFPEDKPAKADIIFIPGNGYPQMAEYAARLYQEGYAPRLLPSGRYSITNGKFSGVLAHQEQYRGNYETEWEFLDDVLRKNGVPQSAILREERATYTWENALFSREAVDTAGLTIRTAILCCRTCHLRRSLLYYQRAFPESRILAAPVSAVDGITRQNWRDTEQGVSAVNAELTRILHQFEVLMK